MLNYGPGQPIGYGPAASAPQFGQAAPLGPEISVPTLSVAQPEYGVAQNLGPAIDVASRGVYDAYLDAAYGQANDPTGPSLDAEIGQDLSTSPDSTPSSPDSTPSSPDYVASVDTGGAGDIFRPLETAGVSPAAQAAESATQGLALNTNALSNLANFISTQNVAVTPGVTPYVGVPATGTPAVAAAPEFGSVAYPTGSTSSGSSGSGTA